VSLSGEKTGADVKQSEIVITGAGLVSPLGVGREAVWRAVLAGKCGIGPLTALEQFEAQRHGGQAPEAPGEASEAALPREVRYLRQAVREALEQASVVPGRTYPPHRCGAMLGTTLHGMRAAGLFLRDGNLGHLGDFSAGSVLRQALAPWAIEGWAATTCSACSSGLGSIALGVTLLQAGQVDLVIAGGYDTISEYAYGGFNSLRLVAEGPLRPFTRGRRGMTLAEGSGIVVLEREGEARGRGAGILARVLGIGESADAHHLTQPHPQGEGAARAIAAALAAAGVAGEQVDLICAHATGTPDNDAGEFAAMAAVWGERLRQVPVVAFKSLMGHTLGGAGSVELILSALAIRDQVIPSCVNVKGEEVEFEGLNLVTGGAKPGRVGVTLNTSLGFGGANTCVVLGEEEMRNGERRFSGNPQPANGNPSREVCISGIGVVVPGGVGNEAFGAMVGNPEHGGVTRDTGAVAEEAMAHLLNSRRVRRMSEYVKLSLAATSVAMADAGIGDLAAFGQGCAAVLGSAHGSAGYSEQYYRQIVEEGIPAANPMLFAEGVPNAAAAHLSLMLSLKGACQTILGTRTAGLEALMLAAMRVASGQWERAVVSAGEEYAPTVNAAYGHAGLYRGERAEGFVAGAGAVTLVLESRASVEQRGGRVRGVVQGWASAAGAPGQGVRTMGRVLAGLGAVEALVSSANGTWIDRVEAGALRRMPGLAPGRVASLYGRVAECYSALPLAGLAAVLLSGVMPTAPGAAESGRVGVIAMDYTGVAAGVRVGIRQGGGPRG
jgi:3-oxoacyl-[acyl-carrier-protein] synthase II